MALDSKNYYFLCIFNFKRNSDFFSLYLLKLCENIFKKFNYPIKKVFYSCNNKSNAPNYERFRILLNKNNGEYDSVNYYSGTKYFLDSDFGIGISDYTSSAIYNPECKDKFQVRIVIKEQRLIDNIFKTYREIVNIFSEFNQLNFSGYGFFVPRGIDEECLSMGIINASYKYSYDMYNLTHWNDKCDIICSIIGYLGVFTNLDDYQMNFLCNDIGYENITIVNNSVIYHYEKAIINTDLNMTKEESFFESAEYLEFTRMCELILPFKKLDSTYNYKA